MISRRLKMYSSKIIKANLVLSFLILNFFASSQTPPATQSVYDNYLEIQSVVPPITLNVCDKPGQFSIRFTNVNSSDTLQTLTYEVAFPVGIDYTSGSILAAVDGVSVTPEIISVSPLKFKISNMGLIYQHYAEVSFMAAASCAIIPPRQQGENAQVITVFNTFKCSYTTKKVSKNFVYQSKDIIETNSYNLKYADLKMPITSAEQSIKTYRYQVLDRDIPVVNATGAGSTNEVRVLVAHDRVNLEYKSATIAAINEDEQVQSAFLPITYVTDDGTNYIFKIDSTVLKSLSLGNKLDGGEGFVIREKVKVKTCVNTITTSYKAQWGCPGSVCNSDPVGSANGSTQVYLVVEKGNPFIVSTMQNIVRPNPCNPNGEMIIKIKNTNKAIKDVAYSLSNFRIDGSNLLVNSLHLYSNANASFSTPISFYRSNGLYSNFIYFSFDNTTYGSSGFSNDPDGVGGLNNLDDDAYYDDLAPGDSIVLKMQFTIRSCPNDISTYNVSTVVHGNFYNGCDLSAIYFNVSKGDGENNGQSIITPPIDLVRGQPKTFSFYPLIRVFQDNLKAIPDSREFFVELIVPKGIVVVPSSVKYQGEGTNVKNTINFVHDTISNIITLIGGGITGRYDIDLDLKCNNNQVNSEIELIWRVRSKITYNSPSCECIRTLVENKQKTFAHFNCSGASSCVTLNSTNGFTMERTTFGWYSPGKTDWYISELTPDKKANRTKPVVLNMASPFDTVQAVINGNINTSNCNPDELQAWISLTSGIIASPLEFISATFTVGGVANTIYSNENQRYTISNNNPGSTDWLYNFVLKNSDVGGTFSSGAIQVIVKFRVVNSSGGGTSELQKLRGGLKALSSSEIIYNESYGFKFTIAYSNGVYIYRYFYPVRESSTSLYQRMEISIQGAGFSTYVNEFRPISHFTKFELEIPSGRKVREINYFDQKLITDYTVENGILKINTSSIPLRNGNSSYINILWDITCSSPNVQTTQNQIKATTFDYTYLNSSCVNCTGSYPEIEDKRSDSYYYSKPLLEFALEANQPGIKNTSTWITRLFEKGNGYSYNTWIAYEPSASNLGNIKLEKVYDSNGLLIPLESTVSVTTFPRYITYGQNNQNILVKIGRMPYNSFKEIRLEASYTGCLDGTIDKVNVFAGWDPAIYPATPQAYTCTPITGTLTLTHKKANLQWEVNRLQAGPFKLCETVPYEIKLNSTGLASMYDVWAKLSIPANTFIDGQIKAIYNGTEYVLPTSGSSFNWQLKDYITSLADGFPGGNKEIKILFNLSTICGFDAGEFVHFGAGGTTNCSDIITYDFQQRIPIIGFNILDNIRVEVIPASEPISRYVPSTVWVKVRNIASNVSATGNIEVLLSPELSYVPNSITCLTCGSGLSEPTIEVRADGKTSLIWSNPPNIGPYGELYFSIKVQNNALCPDLTAAIDASAFAVNNVPSLCSGVPICSTRGTYNAYHRDITIQSTPPFESPIISGAVDPCINDLTADYYVDDVTYATSYVWQLSDAAAGTIAVDANNVKHATITWNPNFRGKCQLFVKAVNGCGEGPLSSPFEINVLTIPGGAGVIDGPTSVCHRSTETYSVNRVEGATSYDWTYPEGVSMVSKRDTTISLRFSRVFNNEIITARAVNKCGNGVPATLHVTVKALPDSSFTGFNSQKKYCLHDEPVQLTPVVEGGIFSIVNGGKGISGSKFYPDSAGRGEHTVRYTVSKDGCDNYSEQIVTVVAPVVSIPNLENGYCINTTPFVLEGMPSTPGDFYFTINGHEYGKNTKPLFNPAELNAGNVLVTYKYIDTDLGCYDEVKRTVAIYSLPSVSITSNTAFPVCAGTEVILTAKVATPNSPPFTYKWSGNETTSSIKFVSSTSLPSTFTVDVVDSHHCKGSSVFNIIVKPSPSINIIGTPIGVTCPDRNDGEITFDLNFEGAGNLIYSVTPHNNLKNHVYPDTVLPNTSYHFTDLSVGNQRIKVKSQDNGCEAKKDVEINNDGPVFEDVCAEASVCDYNNGIASNIIVKFKVSRKRPQTNGQFTYRITGDGVDVNATGSFGVPIEASIEANQNKEYTISLVKENNGDATNICDVTPYKFRVEAARLDLSFDNSEKVYRLCKPNEPALVKVTASIIHECMQLRSGDLQFRLMKKEENSLTPFTEWTAPTEGVNTITFSTITQPGEYLVYVRYRGTEGCVAPASFVVKPMPAFNLDLQLQDIKCYGDSTGYATAIITNNEFPVQYTWFVIKDGKADTLSTLSEYDTFWAGEFNLEVKDANGCGIPETRTFTINQPDSLRTPIIEWLNHPCEAKAIAAGGTPPYAFNWIKIDYIHRGYRPFRDRYIAMREAILERKINEETDTLEYTTIVYYDDDCNPISQPPKGTILPGTYKVEVTDDNGCFITMNKPETIIPNPGKRTYNISFRWNTVTRLSDLESDEVPIATAEAIQADMTKNAIVEKANLCVQKQLASFTANLDSLCSSPESLNDTVKIDYEIKQGYYTLYYYDRVGNLVRTVAPQGVKFYDEKNPVDAQIHEFKTEYAYNNLGQLVNQNTPDGGTTRFIYNNKGQLRFSQNEQQLADNTFSYTKYDELNRVIEVGECSYKTPLNYIDNITVSAFDDLQAIANLDERGFLEPSGITAENRFPTLAQHYTALANRTVTVYNEPEISVAYKGGQRYLLNRVSYTYAVLRRAESYDNGDNLKLREQRSTTYYSYDPHGNVEWVVQEQPVIGRTYISYEYDLISNKVRKVKMNPGRNDAFFHRYEYDEDNRLLAAYTSSNGEIWDKDAKYLYYDHGPLKRIELGQDRIQGIDYAYTLQGWLKAINTPSLNGLTPNEDKDFPRDQFGMVLSYNDSDFVRKDRSIPFTDLDPLKLRPLKNGSDKYRNLYNGNISTWVTANLKSDNTADIMGEQYSYDALNRIKSSRFNRYDGSSYNNPNSLYDTKYSYDLNGNIDTLKRNGDLAGDQLTMDDLRYYYYPGTNKLKHIIDLVNKDSYKVDIDSQADSNYVYDKIGNLIRDKHDSITIRWNVYGKIAEIIPDEAGAGYKQKAHLVYTYDAAGNRISKQVNRKPQFANGKITESITDPTAVVTTYYMRDASGNTMAVYERNNRLVNGHYEAVLKQVEVSLYGSDRLGTYNPDINAELAVLPFETPQDFYKVTAALDQVLKQMPGTQTLVASSQTTDQLQKFSIRKAAYNSELNNYVLDNSDIVTNDGTVYGSVAVAENKFNQPQFYVVPANKPFPSPTDQLMVYDKDGIVMAGSDGLTFDPKQQLQVVNALGSGDGKYIIVTTGTDGLYYHVVDMAKNGGKGEVISFNKQLVAGTGYKSVLLAVEDFMQNRVTLVVSKATDASHVVLQRIVLGTLSASDGYKTLVSAVTPETMVTLSSYGISSVRLSPDGTKMLVYNATSQPAMFDMCNAEIRVYDVTDNLTLGASAPRIKPLVAQAAYGGKATFNADGTQVVVEAREQGGSKLYAYNIIADNLQPLQNADAGDPQLFTDGRIYVSQTGKQSMQAYSSDLTSNFSIALNSNLTGSLGQRVYRAAGDGSFANQYARTVGLKRYELKDHLGNVTAVVSDIKTATTENGQTVYKTGLEATYGYYPFGMLKPGLNTNANTYRYGYNGKEMDNDVKGTGVQYDYGFRIYDARLARFLSVDPLTKEYPKFTPYQFAGNTPIVALDLDGLENIYYGKALTNRFGYMMMMQVLKETGLKEELEKNFKMAVDKSVTKYDLYVLSAKANYGHPQENPLLTSNVSIENGEVMGNMGMTKDIDKDNYSIYNTLKYFVDQEGLSDEVEQTFKDGKVAIFVILNVDMPDLVTKNFTNDDILYLIVSELAFTVTHEIDFHAISTVKGESKDDDYGYSDHVKGYGKDMNGIKQADASPNTFGLKDKSSKAYKFFKRITDFTKKIYKKDENKKNDNGKNG